jgi:ABC-2 type transport system permease protein
MSVLSFLLVLVPAFGLPIRGSLVLFFGVTALYVFAMTSMGIPIALVARNIAQAVLLMILILQPMVFLSGAWNSPKAMSPWLRWISAVSPFALLQRLCVRSHPEGQWLVGIWDVAGIAVLGTILFAVSLFCFERRLATAA